jgi:hypothetical protein
MTALFLKYKKARPYLKHAGSVIKTKFAKTEFKHSSATQKLWVIEQF